MPHEGADGSDYNYDGYAYLVGFGLDIHEVDSYYLAGYAGGQANFAFGKTTSPHMRSIDETVRISD